MRNIANTARLHEIERNRAALTSIVDVVLTSARQNLPLRGHRDDGRVDCEGRDTAENDGNFRSLLRLLVRNGAGDLAKHLEACPGNSMYTSKSVQNDILDCAREMPVKHVVDNIDGKFFSILADETTDRASREQLVLVFRYVDKVDGKWTIREDPVRVVDLLAEIRQLKGQNEANEEEMKMSGQNIGSVIVTKLQELQVEGGFEKMISCAFDGAAAMSSGNVGAAAVLKENDLCDFFHCVMHNLNLAISHGCKQRDIENTMDTIKEVTSFFSFSAKRMELLKRVIKEEAPDGQKTKLVTLCTTRFLERHEAVTCLCELLPMVLKTLEYICDWEARDTRQKADQLRTSLCRPQYIVSLFALGSVTEVVHPVARSSLVRCRRETSICRKSQQLSRI